MIRKHTSIQLFLSLIAIGLLAFFATSSAHAASARPTTTSGGLYTGTFEGTLYGDKDSQAPITLELVQNGRDVTGEITLGSGLIINGGNCGEAAVPAATQTAAGETTSRRPRHLDADATFKVQGITVTVDLNGDLSRDGETITAEAKIDLPWLCGRDPVVTGKLSRVD